MLYEVITMIYTLAVGLDWFPVAFWGPKEPYLLDNATLDYFWHAAMPVFAIGTGMAASIARLTRAGLLEVLSSDYIRTARAKGLRERVVIGIHALKNSLIPVATILGPLLAAAVTGSFVVEQIFVITSYSIHYTKLYEPVCVSLICVSLNVPLSSSSKTDPLALASR